MCLDGQSYFAARSLAGGGAGAGRSYTSTAPRFSTARRLPSADNAKLPPALTIGFNSRANRRLPERLSSTLSTWFCTSSSSMGSRAETGRLTASQEIATDAPF